MTAVLEGRNELDTASAAGRPAASLVEAAKVYLSTRRAAERHRAAAAVIKKAVHGETLVDLGLGLVTGIWRKRQAYRLPVDVAEKVEALEDEIEDLRAPHRVSEPRGSYSWQLVLKVPAECQGPGEWFELGEVSDAEIEALEDDPGRMFEAEEGLIFVRLDEG